MEKRLVNPEYGTCKNSIISMDEFSSQKPDSVFGNTISVGLESGDIIGNTNKELQLAVNQLSSKGGGIVNISAGEYLMYDSLGMKPNVTIRGAGTDTVLKKTASAKCLLVQDVKAGEQLIKVASAEGFREGHGVAIFDDNPDYFSIDIVTVIKLVDKTAFIVSKPLKYSHYVSKNAAAASVYPVITARECNNMAIRDIYIDGNRKENDVFINGCVSGGIYLNKSANCLIENCTVSNYNGDGISLQNKSDHAIIKNTIAKHNTGWGFHPGTQSWYMVIKDSSGIHNDSMGIYICQNVKYGIIENCDFSYNGDTGLDIGYCDTDNRIIGNNITNNKYTGIHIRAETEEFAPHRTLIEANKIYDNGCENGPSVGIQINGEVCDVVIKNNRIGNLNTKNQEYGILTGKNVKRLIIEENEFIKNKVEDIYHGSGR